MLAKGILYPIPHNSGAAMAAVSRTGIEREGRGGGGMGGI